MTSVKEHCCGADLFFDRKTAEKQYRHYLKNGPSRVTAKIIQQLTRQTIEGKSLLDVGGGIGALQWWFLQRGGSKTISIDASSGYLRQAEEHAAKNGWETKTHFILGDYTEVYSQVDRPDYITLDKVVCCYPEFKEILEISCQQARTYVALSYPIDGMISRIISWFGTLFIRFKNNSFRPYVHSVNQIRQVFEQQGYKRVSHALAFPWHIEIYRRVEDI
ncbi:class I SAM-dependent methyltransferase [Maribacter algicola]|uniref:Class I SAM-dependent methyltransferase n=1 Tax=Meishania litoralis TaxID=3434685 RepID=A0ACC7LL68_9FLAO